MKTLSKWCFIVLVGTFLASSLFMIVFWFMTGGYSGLSSPDITDIAKTKLTVDATLFGLSTLSGAIFLDVVKKREKPWHILSLTILSLMGISFLSFMLALIWDFQCLSRLYDKIGLVISVGYTLSGATSGSLYLVWAFVGYAEIGMDEKSERRLEK
jgi:hypothetical protein